jgi:hypothetical protein
MQFMAVNSFRDSPDIVAFMFLHSSMKLFHLQMAGLNLHCSAPLSIASNAISSRAHFKGSYSYFLVFHSIL